MSRLKSLERYAVATEEQFTLCLERYCNDPDASELAARDRPLQAYSGR
jgi:hypothetical protein